MNYSQGKQEQQSYSGLRGTPYADDAFRNAYTSNQDLSNVVRNTRDPAYGGGLNAQGQTQYGGFTGAQMLPGGQYGLGSNADAGVNEMMKRMFGFQSGNAATRGQVAPENYSGVAGSAITRALPSLIPQIQNWQQLQFQAPMQVGGYDVNNANTAAQAWDQAIGSQSQGKGSQFGFGFDPSKLIGTVVPGK